MIVDRVRLSELEPRNLLVDHVHGAVKQVLAHLPPASEITVAKAVDRAELQMTAKYGSHDVANARVPLAPHASKLHIVDRVWEGARELRAAAEYINECREGIRDLVDQ
jgi:hypothetical protein